MATEKEITVAKIPPLEKVIRPIIWRLPEKFQTIALTPFIPLYILFQNYLEVVYCIPEF